MFVSIFPTITTEQFFPAVICSLYCCDSIAASEVRAPWAADVLQFQARSQQGASELCITAWDLHKLRTLLFCTWNHPSVTRTARSSSPSLIRQKLCPLSFTPALFSRFRSRDCLHAAPRSAAPDRSVSVSPAVWLQSRRQGRPCCCVGVDASLVVGSRGYKEVEYLRLSLCFALFVSFESVSCCCRIHRLWPLRCGNNERLPHQLRHPRTLWHLSCFDLTSALKSDHSCSSAGWMEWGWRRLGPVWNNSRSDLFFVLFFSFSFPDLIQGDEGRKKKKTPREGRGDPWR